MGGTPDAPDPPDYTALARASEKSAKFAYRLAKRQQDWAEKTYNENKAVSDLVIDKAIGAMDKAERQADIDRQRYETIYQPLEEQLAAEAENYASPERLEYEAGRAEADVAAQFAAARQTAQDRLEGFGVDPSQTRQGALDLGTRVAEAAAQASAGNQARANAEKVGRDLRSEAINVGRGYPAQVQGSQAMGLQAGNQAANTGLATTASGANTMGTGQGWQQLGNSAITGWGNILNAGFNNQLDAFKADQEASSGWGQVLGTAAGVASNFLPFAEGGAIPEDPNASAGFLPPEMSPSGGAITDDIDAQIDGGPPAKLNAGEFVMPKDIVAWLGEKGMQQIILKARKEMTGGNGERPAQPEISQGPMPPTQDQMLSPEMMGAIPA